MNTIPFYQRPVVLRAEGLVKKYGSRTVVNGVSFQIHEGEIVGLLGANGAGKTTSFRMTCGLIPVNAGKVWIDGVDVTDWPMHRRAKEGKMGYLPQDRSAFGSLTTEDNLYAIMELLGFNRAEQRKRCDELIAKFNLTKVRRTKVGAGGTGGLSGGERRRLEIARALLPHPKILLLDEPFANVDPLTVEEIQSVIGNLSKEGIAVLITDHQVRETLQITNRSYIIHNGKVLCSGTRDEVLSNPEAQKCYFGEKVAQESVRANEKQSKPGESNFETDPFLKDDSSDRSDLRRRVDSPSKSPRSAGPASEILRRSKNDVGTDRGFVVQDDFDDSSTEYRTDDSDYFRRGSSGRESSRKFVENPSDFVPPKPSLKISRSSEAAFDAKNETDASKRSDSKNFVSKIGDIFKKKK